LRIARSLLGGGLQHDNTDIQEPGVLTTIKQEFGKASLPRER